MRVEHGGPPSVSRSRVMPNAGAQRTGTVFRRSGYRAGANLGDGELMWRSSDGLAIPQMSAGARSGALKGN